MFTSLIHVALTNLFNAVVLDFNTSNDKTDILADFFFGLLEQKSGEDRESTTTALQQKVEIT